LGSEVGKPGCVSGCRLHDQERDFEAPRKCEVGEQIYRCVRREGVERTVRHPRHLALPLLDVRKRILRWTAQKQTSRGVAA
jgi:hypothetical protein